MTLSPSTQMLGGFRLLDSAGIRMPVEPLTGPIAC